MDRALERASTSSTPPTSTARTASPSASSAAGSRSAKTRDRVVLATKFRFRMGEGPNRSGASRYRIVRTVEDSLRAAADRSHRPLPDPHAGHRHARGGDAARARRPRARRQGALHRRQQLRRLSADGQPVDESQRSTSSASSRCRRSTAWSCATSSASTCRCAASSGLGILPWSPLAGGFLTGKYRKGQPPPAGVAPRRGWKERFGDFDNERNWRILDAVRAVASELEHDADGGRARVAARQARGHAR